MATFLLTLAAVAVCILLLGFNIFFRKDGKFPETEVSGNTEMRKLGIRCVKEEEMKLWGRKKKTPSCSDSSCSECASCGLYKKEE